MIVMKFGGTSVAALPKVLEAATSRPGKKLIVLSARSGVTNELLEAARHAGAGDFEQASRKVNKLRRAHESFARELMPDGEFLEAAIAGILGLCSELETYCGALAELREATPLNFDYVVSYGELLSTRIFYNYCLSKGVGASLLDSRRMVKTSSRYMNAALDMRATEQATREAFADVAEELAIAQGFIGSDSHGRTTTLGRGGSDLSAAALGAALGAERIEIWSDVTGVLTADPRKLPEAVTIPRMSAAQIALLSRFGAKVLHPETIKPALEKNIPVWALNTFAPEAGATIITSDGEFAPQLCSVLFKTVLLGRDSARGEAQRTLFRAETPLFSTEVRDFKEDEAGEKRGLLLITGENFAGGIDFEPLRTALGAKAEALHFDAEHNYILAILPPENIEKAAADAHEIVLKYRR